MKYQNLNEIEAKVVKTLLEYWQSDQHMISELTDQDLSKQHSIAIKKLNEILVSLAEKGIISTDNSWGPNFVYLSEKFWPLRPLQK